MPGREGHDVARESATAVCQHDARRADQVRRDPPANTMVHPTRYQRTRIKRDVRVDESAQARGHTGKGRLAARAKACGASGAVFVAKMTRWPSRAST